MIRPYRAQDVDFVLDVWYRASRIAHSFLPDAFFEEERHNIVEAYLPAAETWVFEDDGQVIGFVSLIGDEVGAIFVGPERQGAGVGGALMEHAIGLRDGLEVEVFEANEAGRAFYDAFGFELVASRDHEGTGRRLLRLRREPDSC